MAGKWKVWPFVGVGVALLLLINLVIPAFASENRVGAQVTVGPNEVLPDDLYASGEVVTVDGTIKGDLIAFASEIRINGTVEGEVLGAARTVWINGTVGDDVRVAAYQLEITERGTVKHDVNALAFSFDALNGSSIGGDVYGGTYQTQLNGKLDGSFRGATNALYINGTVGHDVLVDVSAPDPQFNELGPLMRFSPVPILGPGLHVGDTGVISGVLKYVSRGEAVIALGAKLSQVVRETPTPRVPAARERVPEPARGFGWAVVLWVIAQFRRLITLAIVGLLLIWLLPRLIPEAAHRLRAKPWQSLGWGCVGEIAFFVSLPILLAVIIGVGLLLGIITLGGLQTVFIGAGLFLEGLYGIAFVVVTSYFTKIVVAFLVGTLLLEQARSKSLSNSFWPLIIGVLLFVIVAAIPILGWLARLAATLFGLGALWLWLRDRWWPQQPALAAVPASGGPQAPLPSGPQQWVAPMPPAAPTTEAEVIVAPEATEPATEVVIAPYEEIALGERPPIPPVEVAPAPAAETLVSPDAAVAAENIEGATEGVSEWTSEAPTPPPSFPPDAEVAAEGMEGAAESSLEGAEEPTKDAAASASEWTEGAAASGDEPQKPRRRSRAKKEEGE